MKDLLAKKILIRFKPARWLQALLETAKHW
jgi:hypothetical protein